MGRRFRCSASAPQPFLLEVAKLNRVYGAACVNCLVMLQLESCSLLLSGRQLDMDSKLESKIHSHLRYLFYFYHTWDLRHFVTP